MNFLDSQAAVQSLISFVLKNSIVFLFNHTGIVRCIRQSDIVPLHLISDSQSLLILG